MKSVNPVGLTVTVCSSLRRTLRCSSRQQYRTTNADEPLGSWNGLTENHVLVHEVVPPYISWMVFRMYGAHLLASDLQTCPFYFSSFEPCTLYPTPEKSLIVNTRSRQYESNEYSTFVKVKISMFIAKQQHKSRSRLLSEHYSHHMSEKVPLL